MVQSPTNPCLGCFQPLTAASLCLKNCGHLWEWQNPIHTWVKMNQMNGQQHPYGSYLSPDRISCFLLKNNLWIGDHGLSGLWPLSIPSSVWSGSSKVGLTDFDVHSNTILSCCAFFVRSIPNKLQLRYRKHQASSIQALVAASNNPEPLGGSIKNSK